MEKTKKYVEDLCDLKEKLYTSARDALAKGCQNVDTHEMGEVVDMIKDLAEAEEKCWKACYYKSIVCAMKKSEEEDEMMMKLAMSGEGGDDMMDYRRGMRRGYDNWRYSSGRFAPTGRGHRSGYMPMDDDMDPWMDEAQRMGYDGGDRGASSNRNQNGSNNRMGYMPSERGDRYDRYNRARMGYNETKDARSKEHMDTAARDYVVDIAESVREVWKDADPAMRKEIKNKLVALTGEMN